MKARSTTLFHRGGALAASVALHLGAAGMLNFTAPRPSALEENDTPIIFIRIDSDAPLVDSLVLAPSTHTDAEPSSGSSASQPMELSAELEANEPIQSVHVPSIAPVKTVSTSALAEKMVSDEPFPDPSVATTEPPEKLSASAGPLSPLAAPGLADPLFRAAPVSANTNSAAEPAANAETTAEPVLARPRTDLAALNTDAGGRIANGAKRISARQIRYRKNPPPIYPRSARLQKHQGTVVLTVAVGKDGRTAEVHVEQSSGSRILDNAAVGAVREWEFEPHTVSGTPIDAEVEIPVVFKLDRR